MTKFTKDSKLALIQGYDSDLLSQTEYANQMGVTKSQFQYWLKLYEMHGETAFTNGYTNYPASFKLDVLNHMAQSDASLMDTALCLSFRTSPCCIPGRKDGDRRFRSP